MEQELYPPSNGVANHHPISPESGEQMEYDSLQRLIDAWNVITQRQHEEQMSALNTFRETHEKLSTQIVSIQRENLSQLNTKLEMKTSLTIFWRSIATLLIGLVMGLFGVGVSLANYLNGLTVEITKLHAADMAMDTKIDRIQEFIKK